MSEELEIRIENDVPLPRRKNEMRYPFAQMQVGQSFLALKGSLESLRALQASLVATAYRYKGSMKFATRLDREHDGVRVWRIE